MSMGFWGFGVIKNKKIKLTKQWTPRDPQKKELTWALRASDLESMKRDNYDIVYIDEVMFTKHTYEKETWSAKG